MYTASGKITSPEKYFESGRQGSWKLLESFKHPHDNYLWYVLAERGAELVSWLYNGQIPGCAHGHYGTSRTEYQKRCARVRRPEMANGRVYCETEMDFYELAGSGGGKFTFSGWYSFHETNDAWLYCPASILTDDEFREHHRRQTDLLDRLEKQIRTLRSDLLKLSEMARRRQIELD